MPTLLSFHPISSLLISFVHPYFPTPKTHIVPSLSCISSTPHTEYTSAPYLMNLRRCETITSHTPPPPQNIQRQQLDLNADADSAKKLEGILARWVVDVEIKLQQHELIRTINQPDNTCQGIPNQLHTQLVISAIRKWNLLPYW